MGTQSDFIAFFPNAGAFTDEEKCMPPIIMARTFEYQTCNKYSDLKSVFELNPRMLVPSIPLLTLYQCKLVLITF